MPDLQLALQLLVSGVVLGSTYALLAVSFGIIYSTTRIFHLAHAVVYTVAAYAAVIAVSRGIPLLIAIVLGIAAAALLGVAMDVFFYRPMRRKTSQALPLFLTALGLLIAGTSLILIGFGPVNRPLSGFPIATFGLGRVTVTSLGITKVAVGWILIAVLVLWMGRSRYGRAVTATSTNAEMAKAVGIPVRRVIAVVFAIGSALAGVAAILFTLGAVAFPTMGLNPVLVAFIAVFLGGIGRVLAAAIGGLALGLITSLSGIWLSGDFAPVVIFGVLFALLIVRPEGILGVKAA